MLDSLVRRQYGLVNRAQLVELGITAGRLRKLVESGRLVRVRRGVFRLCGSNPSWRSSALAVVLASGAGTVLSHRSAAVLWGLLDHHDESGRPLEVSGPVRRRMAGVVAHRHRLDASDATFRFGIPVTTVPRTLLDVAETLQPAELGEMVDEALRRRIVTLSALERQMGDRGGSGRRRLSAMQAVLADRDTNYLAGANPWEQKMDRLWDKWNLPPAARQFGVTVNDHRYVLDRAILDLKIGVEWNGYEYHGLRSSFDRDSRRRSELAAAGWLILDFTSNSPPALICSSVMSVVEQRRRLFGIAG